MVGVWGLFPLTLTDMALLFPSPPTSNVSILSLSSPTVTVLICWLSKAFLYFYAEFGQNLPQ